MAIFSKPLSPHSRHSLLLLLATVLLLRRRLLSAPKDVALQLRRATGKERASAEEVEQALQQVYVQEKDGSQTLLVPHRGVISKVNVKRTPSSRFAADAKHFPLVPPSHKPSVDRVFFRQVVAILRVAVPALRSKETAIVVLYQFFLVLRTILSIGVARLDGRIVRDLVSANGKGFLKGLGLWFALAIPSTYTNTMIRHLQSKLSLRLRTGLTRYTHDLYLSSDPHLRYYRAAHEGGLDSVDQYITSDIAAWCESLSVLYGNILKPSLDILLFTSQLSRSLGVRGTVLLFANYYITAKILRAVTPAFGRLAAVEARLEGEFRAGMGRIARESEEVAFYDGGKMERHILHRAYLRLIRHVNSIYKIRIAYEWTEDYVIKYLWSAAGYGLISIPYLLTRRTRSTGVQTSTPSDDEHTDDAVADRTEGYISSRRLLLSLADAGGRLMYSYKDLLELAGLTTRLYALLSSLHALPALPPSSASTTIELSHVDVGVPPASLVPADADSVVGDFDLASVVAQEPLVRDLSLKLAQGEHLMITGSNGVGKTAVARVLAGLWAPQGGGTATRSTPGELFVVPQRAYMVAGSLLDQIIYPHSYTQYVASGRTEEELMEILTAVHLAYLPAREGGWFTRKEWRDVLSGGEKQRMSLARAFYHRPKFAILDECTSAVSSDVEGRMYEHAKSIGITLITVSLRPSLMKYHTHLLTLSGDGTGSWTLKRADTEEERMGLDREIASLEEKLAEVDKWEKRVKELDALLGVQEFEDSM